MTDQDLIRQLKELRQIKPSQDWVVLTKRQILSEEAESPILVFQWKMAFAPVILTLMIIGLFGFANNTVPGDFFFPLKKVTESAQVSFSSAAEQPKAQLKLANKRLEELTKIAETNQVKNLDLAIEEFQSRIADATKGLAGMDAFVTSSDSIIMKEIVAETQKLTANKQIVESVLGTLVGDTEELENALNNLEKRTASYLIADLENRVLTDEDKQLLEEAKEYFEAGNYAGALGKIWLLYNQ